jgi:hypothetical protein
MLLQVEGPDIKNKDLYAKHLIDMTVNIYSENIFRITRKGPPEKFLKEAYESCIIQKIE